MGALSGLHQALAASLLQSAFPGQSKMAKDLVLEHGGVHCRLGNRLNARFALFLRTCVILLGANVAFLRHQDTCSNQWSLSATIGAPGCPINHEHFLGLCDPCDTHCRSVEVGAAPWPEDWAAVLVLAGCFCGCNWHCPHLLCLQSQQ